MKILVSGASWVTGGNLSMSPDDIDPFNWTKQIAADTGFQVTNVAENGTSADFVARTVISKCEIFNYDYVIAVMPALYNRREIIMRDEANAIMKYQHVPLSGVPGKPMNYATGKYLSSTKQNIFDHFDGYIKNDYEDFSNFLKNTILLGQYLENKKIKHIIMFDLLVPPQFKFSKDCSLAVNQNLTALSTVAKKYISFEDTLMGYLSEEHIDKTAHPNHEGHKLLGQIMSKRILEL